MTMRYRGGGHKKRLRIIDFKRKKYNIPGVVKSIEYDPMRTAYIALLYYVDGEKAYILAPEGLKVGDKVKAGQDVAPEIGHALPQKANAYRHDYTQYRTLPRKGRGNGQRCWRFCATRC